MTGGRIVSPNQRRDLMEIVEDRYGAGSTLITSQLPVDSWHEVIGEPTFADAILDRLVHNAYRLALDGPSMRDPKTAKPDTAAPAPDATATTVAKPPKAQKNEQRAHRPPVRGAPSDPRRSLRAAHGLHLKLDQNHEY